MMKGRKVTLAPVGDIIQEATIQEATIAFAIFCKQVKAIQ